MKMRRREFLAGSAAALVAACTQTTPTAQGQTAPAPSATQRRGPVSLVFAGNRVPTSVSNVGRVDTEFASLVGSGLSTQDPVAITPKPWMLVDLPRPGSDDWKRVVGKSAQVTFRFKPGITWHDGTPFSAKDFVLGWQVATNKDMSYAPDPIFQAIDHVEAPDDLTAVVFYKQDINYANAIQRAQIAPLPRHLVEAKFKADPAAFAKDAFWTGRWVGTGPYKVTDFKAGESATFEAFDKYFLGKPKVDRIQWRFIQDANAILAGVLAGEIDFTLRSAITIDGAKILQRDWEAQGKGKVFVTPTNWSYIVVNPSHPVLGWNAPNQALIRQALLMAIDRVSLSQTVYGGIEKPVHFPMSQGRPAFRDADAIAKKYPYDLDGAKGLMARAGWRPDPDGVLQNDAGQKLVIDSDASSDIADRVATQQAVHEFWRRLGVSVRVVNQPDRIETDLDHRGRVSGIQFLNHNLVIEEWPTILASVGIPTKETQFNGDNISGYTKADGLFSEHDTSFDQARKQQLEAQIAKQFTEDLPFLPILYQSERLTLRAGITGLTPRNETGGGNMNTWNIEQWDVR